MRSLGAVVVKGRLRVFTRASSGERTLVRQVDNLAVDDGLELMASRLVGTAMAVPSHMAIGTGSAAPVAGDSALFGEVARSALTSATATGKQVVFECLFPGLAALSNIAEAGIFNSGAGGTLIARVAFTPFDKAYGDLLEADWILSFAG